MDITKDDLKDECPRRAFGIGDLPVELSRAS